jgi:hypothetical protein
MASGKNIERRKTKREPSSIEAEMYLESTVYKAKVVDISDEGVRFTMAKPINFYVRFKVGEKRISRKVQLVWSGKSEKGGMTYGFNYIEKKDDF